MKDKVEIARIKIRQLVKSDLPALEWDGEFSHFRRLYAEIYHSATQGRAILWVAEVDGNGIVGQLFVQLNSSRHELADGGRRAYIYGFRVKPQYRGQGIGTRMLQAAEADLAKRGFQRVTLNVSKDNLEARHLYERCHYRIVGSEPGTWSYLDEQGHRQDVNEPAWRMEKQLS